MIHIFINSPVSGDRIHVPIVCGDGDGDGDGVSGGAGGGGDSDDGDEGDGGVNEDAVV
jgi:hypothetical protein